MRTPDPKSVKPGHVLMHSSGGKVVVRCRKEDDTGWWNTDDSGLADGVLASGSWAIVGMVGNPCPTCGTRIGARR